MLHSTIIIMSQQKWSPATITIVLYLCELWIPEKKTENKNIRIIQLEKATCIHLYTQLLSMTCLYSTTCVILKSHGNPLPLFLWPDIKDIYTHMHVNVDRPLYCTVTWIVDHTLCYDSQLATQSKTKRTVLTMKIITWCPF